MKNKILDQPFHDSFSDFLEKGEEILWEGSSSLKKDSTTNGSYFFLPLFFLSLIIFDNSEFRITPLVMVPLIFIFIRILYLLNSKGENSENPHFAITNKRVFFRQKVKKDIQTNYIPLDQFTRVELTSFSLFGNPSSIIFFTKREYHPLFQTFFLTSNQPHEKITMEKLDAPTQILKILKSAIKDLS